MLNSVLIKAAALMITMPLQKILKILSSIFWSVHISKFWSKQKVEQKNCDGGEDWGILSEVSADHITHLC